MIIMFVWFDTFITEWLERTGYTNVGYLVVLVDGAIICYRWGLLLFLLLLLVLGLLGLWLLWCFTLGVKPIGMFRGSMTGN